MESGALTNRTVRWAPRIGVILIVAALASPSAVPAFEGAAERPSLAGVAGSFGAAVLFAATLRLGMRGLAAVALAALSGCGAWSLLGASEPTALLLVTWLLACASGVGAGWALRVEKRVCRRLSLAEADRRIASEIVEAHSVEVLVAKAGKQLLEALEAKEIEVELSSVALRTEPLRWRVRVDEPQGRWLPFSEDECSTKCESTIEARIQASGTRLGLVRASRKLPRFSEHESGLLEAVAKTMALAIEKLDAVHLARVTVETDPVTGLMNHRGAQDRIAGALVEAQERNRPLSLLLADVRNFRSFNGTYGHRMGDDVLRKVASKLREHCPEYALIARFGGDEFLVMLPDTPGIEAAAFAERLQQTVEELAVRIAHEERAIPIGISVGAASFPEDCASPFRLLSLVEDNLRLAQGSYSPVVAETQAGIYRREGLNRLSYDLLDSMVTAVDNKDSYTRLHSEEVTEYALWIADEIGLEPEQQSVLRLAGLLHDVGKIGVPYDILRKPGRLSEEEFEVMRQHPTIGAMIVSALPDMQDIVDGVLYHHERYDGKGYPKGLAGARIPLLGRLLAVADAFSAMTTNRPYRRGMEWNTALTQIRDGAGTQFDPELAEAFLVAADKRWREPISA